MKTPVPTEHQEQAAFIQWFRLTFPRVLIYAIPNGAHLAGSARQRAAKMAALKAEGFVNGMPDLHIPEWRLWIEMKRRKGGRVSDDQAAIHARLRAMRDGVIVAEGWEAAREAVQSLRGGKADV